MPDAPWVRVETERAVARLVLDRPPVNSYDVPFVDQLTDAIDSIDAATRAVVVRSDVPGVFAAGGDIRWMATAPHAEQVAFAASCQRACSLLERLPMPTVAAVDGACLGGGLELALACDIRVVGATATLGLPEPSLGLIAGAGGIQRLVRALGQGTARDLLLTGRRISGTEAVAIGLASRLVEAGDAVDTAERVARDLASLPPEAVQATKRLAVLAPDVPMDEGLLGEREAWAAVRASTATQRALEAFASRGR